MNYTLIVQSAPQMGHGSDTALAFAEALLRQGHQLQRVFFYQDGAENALATCILPQNEDNVRARWTQFGRTNDCELAVCIAASLRRGVLNDEEAERYEQKAANTAESFVIVGLGQLVDAVLQSDRCITFVD